MSFTTEEISSAANRRFFLCGSSAVQYGKDVYIFGGFDGEVYSGQLVKFTGSCERFDLITPERCPLPRSFHGACVLGHRMYIYGGKNGELVLDDLWEYDFKSSQFRQLSLQTRIPALYRHAMCAVSTSEFMIFGGARQNNKLEQQQYLVNPETLQVQSLSDLYGPAPAVGASLTTLPEQKQQGVPQYNVYLFGGAGLKGFSQEVWRFQNRRWFQLRVQRAGPLARADQSFVQVSTGQILLFAGENGPGKRQKLSDLWIFDINSLQWQRMPEQQVPARSQFASWFSKGALFVAGGTGCDAPIQRDAWKISLPSGAVETALGGSSVFVSKAEQPLQQEEPQAGTQKKADELSLNDLRRDAGIFGGEKPALKAAKETVDAFPEERPKEETAIQRSQMNLVELRGELEFKLRVLDARLDIMQKESDELRHLKQQFTVGGGRQSAVAAGNDQMQLNEFKTDVTTQLMRHMSNQLMQTQQELTQGFKALLKDQITSVKQDTDFNTGNITRLGEQLDEIRKTLEVQSQRANDAIKFDPRIAGFEQQLRVFQTQHAQQDEIIKALEEGENELRTQFQEVSGGATLRKGLEVLVDEKTSTLRMKIAALEQRVFAAEQEKEVEAFEKEQMEKTLKAVAGQGEGEGARVLNVLSITDEAFKQKLMENLGELGFVKQSEIDEIVEKKIKVLRERDAKAFKGQTQMLINLSGGLNALHQKLTQVEASATAIPGIQSQLLEISQDIARMKRQLEVVGEVPLRESTLAQDVAEIARSELFVSTGSSQKRVRFTEGESSESSSELLRTAQRLGLTSQRMTEEPAVERKEEEIIDDAAALAFYLQQSTSNSGMLQQEGASGEGEAPALHLNAAVQRCFFDESAFEKRLGALCGTNGCIAAARGSEIVVFQTDGVQDVPKPHVVIQTEGEVTALFALKNALIAGTSDGTLTLFGMPSGLQLQEVCSFSEKITALIAVAVAGRDDQLIVCGTDSGQLGVWDLANLDFQPLGAISGAVLSLEIRGEQLMAFSHRGFKQFDLQERTEVSSVEFENETIQSCVASSGEVVVGQEAQIMVVTGQNERHAIQLSGKLCGMQVIGATIFAGFCNGCIQTLSLDGTLLEELVVDPERPIGLLGHADKLLWMRFDEAHITGLDFK